MRAIAAWLVIADHALLELTHNRPEDSLTHVAWTLGSVGVYVFFVLSGFVMVHISWDRFAEAAAAPVFLRRRIVRIVPLYWLATLAALAYHRVSATHGANAGWSELVKSLAFIPYSNEEGTWNPVLPQGWTLDYEMMFYAIFALGLLFPRRLALPLLALTLGAFVVVGMFVRNETVAYLASPIILWFLLGIGLGAIWRWRRFEEPVWVARTTKILEPLGDASYSTYLAHGLVLTVLLRVWTMAFGLPSILLVPVSLIVATIAGWATHAIIEKPMLRLTSKVHKSERRVA
jgi:peptidoglycan/LPS O-acetylase OafA/YrhL